MSKPSMPLVRPGQLVFRVHGPIEGAADHILGDVFSAKLGALVAGLKAADRAIHNGRSRHQYAIARLKSSTPTVVLAEERIKKYRHEFQLGDSGIDAFDNCADAIRLGDRERALRFGRCPYYIQRLGSGASKDFGYAEIWTRPKTFIRVDPFLEERAQKIFAPKKEQVPAIAEEKSKWFKGAVHGSFDGSVLEVDLRGALPQFKLILNAGGQEIDCIATEEHLDKIRQALNNRVRVYGEAIYDGASGLPRRITISDIQPIVADGDFTKWKGAFSPFDNEWEGDDV